MKNRAALNGQTDCGSAEDRPLISVIVPVYNMEQYLDRCVQSVLRQTYEPMEILLVDDGSADGSPEMCDLYAQKDDRVSTIHQKNAGLSGAKNTGIEHAAGEYLVFIDADDEADDDYVSSLFGLVRKYSVSMAACNHSIVRGGKSKKRFSLPQEECVLDAHTALENVCYQKMPDVSSWGKIYHRTLFDGLRFPVGRLYEDTYVFAELMLRAGRIAYTPESLYRYIQRTDSLSHGSFSPEKLQYIDSVVRLANTAVSEFPDLKEAAMCRKVFAALSVRRFFVDCAPERIGLRGRLEKYVRKNRKMLLGNPRVPMRDKIAALALSVSPKAYDILWKAVEKGRSVG